jgi:hypothetical protein
VYFLLLSIRFPIPEDPEYVPGRLRQRLDEKAFPSLISLHALHPRGSRISEDAPVTLDISLAERAIESRSLNQECLYWRT